ncbi:MAG: CYTH domain-containing protein, partial [Acidimicrobiales bacterium]
MAADHPAIEREVKLGAWPGFQVPDLGGLGDGLVPVPLGRRTLTATYYDTADLRLARWGASLRHRTGDEPAWTVKLPRHSDGPALVRREVGFEGPAGVVPAGAAALVLAFARSSPLVAVA